MVLRSEPDQFVAVASKRKLQKCFGLRRTEHACTEIVCSNYIGDGKCIGVIHLIFSFVKSGQKITNDKKSNYINAALNSHNPTQQMNKKQ